MQFNMLMLLGLLSALCTGRHDLGMVNFGIILLIALSTFLGNWGLAKSSWFLSDEGAMAHHSPLLNTTLNTNTSKTWEEYDPRLHRITGPNIDSLNTGTTQKKAQHQDLSIIQQSMANKG